MVGHVFPRQDWVREITYSWHVPLFFVLSGYFWRTDRSLRDEVRSRTATLLQPYVAWLVLVGLYFLWRVGHSTSDLVRIIEGGTFITTPFTAFWFITALFFSTIFYRVLAVRSSTQCAVVMVAALALGVLLGHWLERAPESIGVAVPCVGFVAFGDLLRRGRSHAPNWLPWLIVPCLVAELTGLVHPLDLKHGDFGTTVLSLIIALVICAGLIVVFERAIPSLPERVSRISIRIASVGLVIILAHGVFLKEFGNPAVMLLLGIGLPTAFGLLAERTPASQWLTGRPRRVAAM